MSTPPVRRDVIVIGASAGGLPHLSTLLELLPADLPAIVLVVLHRPGDRASQLREVLARRSQMQVVEAVHGEELLVGVCYLGQPAEHLGIDELVQAKLTADPGGARRGWSMRRSSAAPATTSPRPGLPLAGAGPVSVAVPRV